MHLEWDQRGIQFPAAEALPPRTETVSSSGLTIHRVPWDALEAIEPVDPWPQLRICWRGGSEVLSPDPEDAATFAARVEDVVAEAQKRVPDAACAGWLAAPVCEWERAMYLPGEPLAPHGEGAYRSPETPGDETIVAVRPPLTVIEAFFDWLASTSAFAFRQQPLAIVLTADDVYARFRDDSVKRLPRAALRTRIEVRRAGTVYVFGRAARLLVSSGPSNAAVRAELDAQLARS